MADQDAIDIEGSVVFFTGAGISVGAGLPTYRGSGGLYTTSDRQPPSADDVTPERLPDLWARFAPRLAAAEELRPAAAHRSIVAFEDASTHDVTVVTQNVDGLHRAAGSTRIVELHGSLTRVRCLASAHRHQLAELGWTGEGVPACPDCGAACRPDIVLFGESLDPISWDAAEQAVRGADCIVAVGTSAVVYPAAYLIEPQFSPGARRIWINPETLPPSRAWLWLRGSADEQVARLVPQSP